MKFLRRFKPWQLATISVVLIVFIGLDLFLRAPGPVSEKEARWACEQTISTKLDKPDTANFELYVPEAKAQREPGHWDLQGHVYSRGNNHREVDELWFCVVTPDRNDPGRISTVFASSVSKHGEKPRMAMLTGSRLHG